MRRIPFAVLLACTLVVVALGASCSRDQPLADWLRQADEICRRAQESADKNPAPQSNLPGDKLRLSVKRSRDELDELKKLDTPSERTSPVAEYLITLEHRADALELYADELDKAPAQGPLPSRTTLEQFTSEAYTKATALGLEQCAGGVDFAVDTTTTTTTTPGLPVDTAPVPTGIAGQPEGEETTQDQ